MGIANNPTNPNNPLDLTNPPIDTSETAQPVQPPPDWTITFNDFLSKYAEANPASGLAALQMTPESLAVLAGKKGVGETSQVLSGIGSAARGFAEGWAKTRPQMSADEQLKLAQAEQIRSKGGKDSDTFKIEDKLAEDYKAAVKPYNEDLQKYNQVTEGINSNSPTGDATALLSYAKLIVPTLRTDAEAAEAIAANVSGLGILQNAYDKAIKNKRIGDDERKNLITLADKVIADRKLQFDNSISTITKRANAWDIPLSRIEIKVQDIAKKEKEQPKTELSTEEIDTDILDLDNIINGKNSTAEEKAEAQSLKDFILSTR